MSDLIIRPVTQEDAEAIFDLRLTALKTNPEAFGSDYENMLANYNAQSYSRRIPPEGSDNIIICAELDGQLVGMMGFVRATRPKTKHSGDIWGAFVRSDYRGQGVGKQIMAALMQHIKQCDGLKLVSISVITDNPAAIRLYESYGFVLWGTQPAALYAEGVYHDVHWMSYQL